MLHVLERKRLCFWLLRHLSFRSGELRQRSFGRRLDFWRPCGEEVFSNEHWRETELICECETFGTVWEVWPVLGIKLGHWRKDLTHWGQWDLRLRVCRVNWAIIAQCVQHIMSEIVFWLNSFCWYLRTRHEPMNETVWGDTLLWDGYWQGAWGETVLWYGYRQGRLLDQLLQLSLLIDHIWRLPFINRLYLELWCANHVIFRWDVNLGRRNLKWLYRRQCRLPVWCNY